MLSLQLGLLILLCLATVAVCCEACAFVRFKMSKNTKLLTGCIL